MVFRPNPYRHWPHVPPPYPRRILRTAHESNIVHRLSINFAKKMAHSIMKKSSIMAGNY